MVVRRIPPREGVAAWNRWLTAQDATSSDFSVSSSEGEVSPADIALAVRFSLQILVEEAPGASVEVRVVPYGAVQIIEGVGHRRGTPPAVVEMRADVWLRLASGLLTWEDALADASVEASGERADLQPYLPLRSLPLR